MFVAHGSVAECGEVKCKSKTSFNWGRGCRRRLVYVSPATPKSTSKLLKQLARMTLIGRFLPNALLKSKCNYISSRSMDCGHWSLPPGKASHVQELYLQKESG